jgi:fatty-acyl-CoA synthase
MKLDKSYLSGPTDVPLLRETIGDLFDQTVGRYPDNDALISKHQNIRLTYRELQKQVDTCARGLIAIGVRKGDRVGIWSPNCAEWTVTQFATAKLGAILVNINPSYRLHELEYALNQSECRTLVIADHSKYSNYTQMLYDVASELESCKPGELKSAAVPNLRNVVCIHPDPRAGMFSWDDLKSLSGSITDGHLKEQQESLSFEEPINIQYTSGTTGFPKGATLSHHNILNNAYFTGQTMKFTDQERVVIPVPLYHCFGMVIGNLACLTFGAAMIYPGEGFEPAAVLRAVEEEKATALYGVPTMFIAELEDPNFSKFDLSSLRTGVMAGSPCPVEVMKKVQTLMHMDEVQIAYGMTETSPVSTQTRMDTPLAKQVGTVGQVHPHVEIKIIDPDTGSVVPVGTSGELCMKGYNVMLGYWNDPERTAEAIDADCWMHSGDLALIDEDGFVSIVGRIKDMIIRGGENIYPREIEEFLYTHPNVSDVQIIGVPDQKFGEEVMAWIKLKDGNATEEEMREFCKGKIAHFKIPKYYKFTDDFPMTVTGKVRKVEMREISIRELNSA